MNWVKVNLPLLEKLTNIENLSHTSRLDMITFTIVNILLIAKNVLVNAKFFSRSLVTYAGAEDSSAPAPFHDRIQLSAPQFCRGRKNIILNFTAVPDPAFRAAPLRCV